MLPQTRQKLRVSSMISLAGGFLLLCIVWFVSEPLQIAREAHIPSFWEVLSSTPSSYEEVRWKVWDLEVSYQFFCNLLRTIVALTIFTSALCIVVLFNDMKLTRK